MADMTQCTCTWCKKPFQARTADVNRGWAKFCSKKCKANEQEKRTGQNRTYHAGRCSVDGIAAPSSRAEVNDEMHEQALYDAFSSHGQDGF